MAWERIVAVGLLTQRELDLLGPSFTCGWPLDDSPCFGELIEAIDAADNAGRPAHAVRGGP